jgi:hypothetical protein
MPLKLYWLTAVLLLISLATRPAPGNEIVWRLIGLRGGVYDGRNDEDFKQYEGFTTWKLPWARQWDSGWTLGTFLRPMPGCCAVTANPLLWDQSDLASILQVLSRE